MVHGSQFLVHGSWLSDHGKAALAGNYEPGTLAMNWEP
jgi:hypothetical protein